MKAFLRRVLKITSLDAGRRAAVIAFSAVLAFSLCVTVKAENQNLTENVLITSGMGTFSFSSDPGGEANGAVVSGGNNRLGQPSSLVIPQEAALPVKVHVGMMVNRIYQINEQAGTFTANVDLHFRWQDSRLRFDKRLVGTDRQELSGEEAKKKLAAIWNPAVVIDNLSGQPQREETGLWIFSDGTVYQVRRLTGTFESRYNLNSFPFDTQALTVRLLSGKYSANNVEFISEQKDLEISGLRQGFYLQGWDLKNVSFTAGRQTGWNGAPVSVLMADIHIKRQSVGHIFLIFIPLLVLITLPLFYLWDERMYWSQRLGALSGNILAFITLNFTVTLRYPALDVESAVIQTFRVGFAYFLGMLLLVGTVYNPYLIDKLIHKDYIEETRKFLRWGLPAVIYSFMLYTILSGLNR